MNNDHAFIPEKTKGSCQPIKSDINSPNASLKVSLGSPFFHNHFEINNKITPLLKE